MTLAGIDKHVGMPNKAGVTVPLGPKWKDVNVKPELSPWLLDVIAQIGFERTTPVQSGVIPRAMKNQDCVVEAVTGSGKTLAFVIPILERIYRRADPYKSGQIASIIIAPTRELAQQIHEILHRFISTLHHDRSPSPEASSSKDTLPSEPKIPLPLLVTSGMTNLYETFTAQTSNILVGTPGRLASFLLSPRGSSLIRVSELDTLVLDEADRLLSSPDHRKDVERIMGHLPKQRRTHLFSATMTDAVEEMVGLGLRNPVKIVVNMKDKRNGEQVVERRMPTSLENTYLVCRHAEKTLQLSRILRQQAEQKEAAKFIVYFSTGAAVDYFYRILTRLDDLASFSFTSLHGDLLPRIREKAMENFISHPSSHLSPAVLLCTDLAARGVDFDDVDVVIQYDPPTDPKTFSHRAGRTARAGRKGSAVILLGKGKEEDYVEFLRVRKIPLKQQWYIDHDLNSVDPPSSLDQAALELRDHIRQIITSDRELADKGARSFVSSIKAYTKHEASFLFRVADLDLGGVATAFGLLRLPAMPEVRSWKQRLAPKKQDAMKSAEGEEVPSAEPQTPWEDADINWDTFAYASKQREEARLAALKAKSERPENRDDDDKDAKKRKAKAEIREAWSEQKEKKARKELRRDKKDKRKQAEWEKLQAEGANEEAGPVEAFKRSSRRDAEHGEEKVDVEYQNMKKELRAEKQAKKGDKGLGAAKGNSGGMFDDLD